MFDSGDGIIVHDLRQPLPFADGRFDVVYHSHTLEHLEQREGERLLQECRRVLAPGGVLRVVVPDLEQIARAYLAALDAAASAGAAQTLANHEWMIIEMVDQLARHRQGGELTRFIARPELVNADFVGRRWGAEGRSILATPEAALTPSRWTVLLERLRRVGSYPTYVRELVLRVLLGPGYRIWSLGRYRLSGDPHLWMYDRVSLARAFVQCGFTDVVERAADDSYVADWRRFNLDTEPDGAVYRPNSLFIEGRRSA